MVQATCHLDPELGQQTTQHVHKLRTLPHQQIARPMQRQRRLLLGRLHRHEAHGWPRHRLADRLSIPCIRLAPLHIGLHVGWRHQPHLVAKLCQLARPMMRGAASFHADEAGGKLGKERQNLRPPQRLADDNVSFSVDGMDLKDALGQIEADGGDLHSGWLLYRVVAATAPLQGVRMPSTGAGAIHPICFQEVAKLILNGRDEAQSCQSVLRRSHARTGTKRSGLRCKKPRDCTRDAPRDQPATNHVDTRRLLPHCSLDRKPTV